MQGRLAANARNRILLHYTERLKVKTGVTQRKNDDNNGIEEPQDGGVWNGADSSEEEEND